MPNYPDDMSAMLDAEARWVENPKNAVDNDDFLERYYAHLDRMKGGKKSVKPTSRQRAEAFLRTVGKWSEDLVPIGLSPTPLDDTAALIASL